MKSIYKKIIATGLLGALFGLTPVYQAQAVDLGIFNLTGITSTVVTFFSQVLLGLLLLITQAFFMITGFFIELAMKMNNNILDPTTNKFLFNGWTVFVNVADLALVVALIVIAFATMLNSQTYGMQKALPKLIVVALLVNFSLVIPGVLIDLSGMVTAFFIKEAGLTGTNISNALATAMNVSGFLDVSQLPEGATGGTDVGAAMATLTFGAMRTILNMVFIIVFTAIATIILATLAIMLFIRYFMLSFLLLMTPLIFVSWIFPTTRSHWDKWWNDFLRWTMFPPVIVFFMWLSLTALKASRVPETTTTGSAGAAVQKLMNFQLGALINMAMAVMLMILSLVAANGISIKGAKGGKDMIGTMTNWGQGKIQGMQKYGRREGERLGRRAGAPVTAAIGRGAAGFRKYEGEKGGVLGYAAGKIGRAGGRLEKNQQDALKKAYDDKFKGMSIDDKALRRSTMGTDEKFFADQELAKAGKMGKVGQDILDKDIASADVKRQYEALGGPDAFKNFMKSAGRNDEMVNAQKDKDKNDAKIRDVEAKISALNAPGAEPNLIKKNAEANRLQEEKEALEKGGFKEAADKFYDTFERKDFEKLGAKFYTEGKYADVATRGMLRKEPGAFGKIVSGMEKSGEAQAFNEKAIDIMKNLKDEALAAVQAKQGNKIEEETNKELLSVMKSMKEFDQKDAEGRNLRDKLKWIEEKDIRMHAALGGEKLADNLEQQLKLLLSRKNMAVGGMEEVQLYRKNIETVKSLDRNISKRLYGGSDKEEKKEEKQEEKKA